VASYAAQWSARTRRSAARHHIRVACSALAAALVACAGACGGTGHAATGGKSRVARDDFGDTVPVGHSPTRIVSLNPTTTAMLYAMGDGERLVGRTHWDTYPAQLRAVADVGDGLRPNVEAVLALRPDLVVLYASDDDRAAAATFQRTGVPTLSVRVDRISDFNRALRLLGVVTGDTAAATRVADSVQATLDRVRAATAGKAAASIVWVVDESPLRIIGGGSYLSDLVADAGGRNVYAGVADAAPEVSIEDILHRNPDIVLTSPSIARAIRGDARWRSWLGEPSHRILVPDTALVGMPSVRMGEAATQLSRLLHGDSSASPTGGVR
jgi:iron complex transport system substrate-binding protein